MNEKFLEENSKQQSQDQSEIKNILNSEINFNNNFHSNDDLNKQEHLENLPKNAFNLKSRNFDNNTDNNNLNEINTNSPSSKNKISNSQINTNSKITGNGGTSKFKSSNNPRLVRTPTTGIMFLGEKREAQNDSNADDPKINTISESQQKLYENVNTNNLNLNSYLDNNKKIDNNDVNNNFNNKNLNRLEDKNNNLNSNIKRSETKFGIENKTKVIPVNENPPVTRKKSIKKIISEILDKNITALIMSIATIYALILSDLNVIFFTPDVDTIFNIFSGIVFFLFLIEFVLSITTKEDYNWTFFFWLDLLSIFSMILNIDWIIYPFLEFFSESTSSESSLGNVGLQKVVRNLSGVVRLTRVTRLLRIIRIIRLIRLLKLYKNVMIAKKNLELKKAQERMRIRKLEEIKQKNNISDESSIIQSGKEENEVINRIQNKHNLVLSSGTARKRRFSTRLDSKKKEEISETPYEDILSESKISEKLSSSMTKLIITLIMLLLLTFPYMSYELYSDGDLTNYSILLKYIENYFGLYGELTSEMNFTFLNLLNKSMDDNYPIINITYNNSVLWKNYDLENDTFRYDEVNYYYNDDGLTLISYGTIFDNRLSSILNIARTVYVAVILGWMIVKLDEDSKTHALYPLENIMSIIQTISRDPIGSRNTQRLHGKANKNLLSAVESKEIRNKSMLEKQEGIAGGINNKYNNDLNKPVKIDEDSNKRQKELDKKERNKLKSKSNFEVKTIEAAVIKISALLAIGFGEAGEAIIKHNLKPGTQEVNPMVKGRKKIAIFGFCDIRQFPIVNECLQERTMSFVNQIANIVHTSVDLFMGAANKNIGDAFLCVWKFLNSKKNKNKLQKQIPNQSNQVNSSDEANQNYDKSLTQINKSDINLNTMIINRNNFFKKTNLNENYGKYFNKENSQFDEEIKDKSLIGVVDNNNFIEDNSAKINKMQQLGIEQKVSDNNISSSNNCFNYNNKNKKNNLNTGKNNMNTNTQENNNNNTNVNNNTLSTSPNNNNINYNININVLSIPNNNIKININNNNFINNTSSNTNMPGSSPNVNSNDPNEKSSQKINPNLNLVSNNKNNYNEKQISSQKLGANGQISNKFENKPLITEQEVIWTNKILNNKFKNNNNMTTNQNQGATISLNNKRKILVSKESPAAGKEGINQTEAADRALLGYLHIIKCINKRPNILIYRTDADILNRIPNYKVKMGFGLHIGWAIEGAIGSHHKIDASYLSPNVNMSARLEAATKQYGVSILLSGDLYDSLSPELRDICRFIDVVTVKGSNKPIKLFTVDLNLDLTPSEKDQPNINLSENRKFYEEKKERFYEAIHSFGGSIGNFMKTKASFRELLDVKRPSAFRKVFVNAMDNYIKGDWEKARKYLNKALELDPSDGPGKTIFDYLSTFDFKAPPTWKGFRELSSK